MSLISINGNELDPIAQTPALRAFGLHSEDASKSNYILIQTTTEPLSNEQEDQLESLGVSIHEYVSQNTYLCGYTGSDLSIFRSLPFIKWANVYLDLFVIQSKLKTTNPDTQALLALSTAPKTRRTHLVDIMMHHDVDANAEAVKEGVAAAAHADQDSLTVCSGRIRLTVEEQYLDNLAALDYVRLIKKSHAPVLFNNKAAVILNNDNLTVEGVDYEGDGEIIAVADTGFDIGKVDDTHPAFTGRVKKLYALGRSNKTDDPEGHGTHVCGSALGDGMSETMGGRIRGSAPKASLVLQSVLDRWNGLGGIPSDLNDLFRTPYTNDGARIHTNSWGSSSVFWQLPYDASSNDIDQFIWEHQDMSILFAAGNDGVDYNFDGVIDPKEVGSQAAAKNCITVGASENNRPDINIAYGSRYPAAPLRTDLMANAPEGMAAFSSRGPTKEGRIKPDIVAPGTAILSTLSRAVKNPTADFGVSTDPAWWFLAGTSMATPLVAGSVAVIRETLVKNGTPNPSAALVKALLINGATELIGQYVPSEAGPSPNSSSGFGLVNVQNSIILPSQKDAGFHEGAPLRQGEGDDNPITVSILGEDAPTGGPTLKVTLVWSDPPGEQLQNDLDLIVTAPDGTERHGNMGDKPGFDRANNVEQVVWTNIPTGEVKIVVRAYHIARKAAPQPYAVVWSINRPLK